MTAKTAGGQPVFSGAVYDAMVRTKRYEGSCEYVSETSGNATSSFWLTCLTGPTGVYAVVETRNGTNTVHYVLKVQYSNIISAYFRKVKSACFLLFFPQVFRIHCFDCCFIVVSFCLRGLPGRTIVYNYYWIQEPSLIDIQNAGTQIHYVFGRWNNTVYIYNIYGVQTIMRTNNFIKIGL